MKDIEWSEAHTDALTEFDHYFNTRYQKAEVVPYAPAPAQLPVQATKPAPVVTLDMKRYIVAGSATTFFVAVIAAAEQGAFKLAGAALAWIVFPAVGVGLAWVVLRACFTWSPSTSVSSGSGSGHGGDTHHHYYNNQQGPNGQQSNQSNSK